LISDGQTNPIEEFSIEAIWAEMATLKQNREQLDETFKKITRTLQDPEPQEDSCNSLMSKERSTMLRKVISPDFRSLYSAAFFGQF